MLPNLDKRCSVIRLALTGALLWTSAHAMAQVTVPPALQPADAKHPIASLTAAGVQIYVCKRDADGQLAWSFKAPQADLYDATGRLVVRHYAGPTWEAVDGSTITGKVLQQAANTEDPDNSIPLLLLQATSAGSPGLLSSTRYVQRLATSGGIAPARPCTEAGQEGRSPYLANYIFLE